MTEGSQVVIYGAGDHGRVVAEMIELLGGYCITGFVDDDVALQGQYVEGYPVLGDRTVLRELPGKGVGRCIIAIGNNAVRRELAPVVEGLGLGLITVIHPTAQISRRATVGQGTLVEACSVVKTGSAVGRLGIINSCVSIGHDVVLGEGVQISPGVSIGGWVEIGDGTLVGMGASVIPKVRIGNNVVIGANAAVIRDLPDNVVAVGVPARIIRARPVLVSPREGEP